MNSGGDHDRSNLDDCHVVSCSPDSYDHHTSGIKRCGNYGDGQGTIKKDILKQKANSSILHEKRKKNNQACKKFRKARKNRQQQLYLILELLQKENYTLISKIDKLEIEIKKWKEFFEKNPRYCGQSG